MEIQMERKPWEPFVAVKTEMIGGVPYVEARYLQECVAEIARLNEALADATDYRKTPYLTASEREKLQAVLNASLRNAALTGGPKTETSRAQLGKR
jgi:hypothetical protein